MPTGKTISAREANVFLPGARVEGGWRGWGYVFLPSRQHMQMQHGESDVAVMWEDGSMSWVDQKELTHRSV